MLPRCLSRAAQCRTDFQQHILELSEQAGSLPKEVRVAAPEASDLLAPIARALGVKLRESQELKMLDAARESLMAYFGGFE